MSTTVEWILAICGILLFIGFLYIVAFFAFARKMQILRNIAPIKVPGVNINIQKNISTPTNKSKQCSQCGNIYNEDYGFCPRCGADIPHNA